MSEQPPQPPDQSTPPGGYGAPLYQQPPSQQPPRQQPGYPPPVAYPLPQKKRPRAWWFAVGASLMLAGIGIGVALFVSAYNSATQEDGVITADGRPASISAPAGQKRMLFVPTGERAPLCELVDGSGRKLLLRPIFGDATLTTGGADWQAFDQVDTSGDGRVTLTCTPTASGGGSQVQVRMGAPIDVATIGGGVVGGFAALFLLGGTGFVILLITTILWFSRKPVARV